MSKFNLIPQFIVFVISIFFTLTIFTMNDSRSAIITPMTIALLGSIFVIISTILKLKKISDISEYILAILLVIFSVIILYVSYSIIF